MVNYAYGDHSRVFRLKPCGESHAAASALFAHVETALAAEPLPTSGPWGDLRSAQNDFYRRQFAELAERCPRDMQAIGLMSPVVQVEMDPDALPRAYEILPTVYVDTDPRRGSRKRTDFYLFAPVAYNASQDGHAPCFRPVNATLLDPDEANAVKERLFGGGWGSPLPLFSINGRGVATPADFDPARHLALDRTSQADPHTLATFIADGPSLDMVQDFRERQWASRKATDRVLDRLTHIVTVTLRPDFQPQLAPGEGYTMNSSVKDMPALGRLPGLLLAMQGDGKAMAGANPPSAGGPDVFFEISARRDGSAGGLSGGRELVIPENRFFETNGRAAAIPVIPRMETAEGRALAELMAAMPRTPSLGDYPGLHGDFKFTPDKMAAGLGQDGAVPRLEVLNRRNWLVYHRDRDCRSAFCPDGAVPMPVEAYHWVRSDEADLRTGRTPPPVPKVLAEAMRSRFGSRPALPRRAPRLGS
jgi:hypothetical protein